MNAPAMQMPGEWAICPGCDGHGHHSKDFGAISSDDWNGPDWDDDSRESYMRGDYDKVCSECGGSGKVWAVKVAACTFAQKRELVRERQSARWAAEERAERRRESM
jgi:DnaJ-class molecular chaperone